MTHAVLHPVRWLAVLVALAALLMVPAAQEHEAADAAGTDACGTLLPKSTGGYWKCSFVDNFRGTSLNTNKWAPQITALSGFYMNQTCFKNGQGYAVYDGLLRLRVYRHAAFTCKVRGADMTAHAVGGGVSTYTKFDQAYGRFEARIKFPQYDGEGLQGGYWMNPTDRTYGPWPASGEIDAAEWYSGLARHLFPSLHYTGRTAYDTAACAIDRTKFHRITLLWTSTRMRFWYDGALCFSRAWEPTDVEAPAPFDKPFTVSLIAALGAGDNAPTRDTPSRSRMYVDYVKVWR